MSFKKTIDKAIKVCDGNLQNKYEVIVDGKNIGTVQVFRQALKAAEGYSKKNGKPVKVREMPTGMLWTVYPDGSVKW